MPCSTQIAGSIAGPRWTEHGYELVFSAQEDRLAIGKLRGELSRDGRTRRRVTAPASPMFVPAAAFLLVWVAFGGAMPTSVPLFVVLGLAGTFLLGALVLRGSAGTTWRALALPARLLLVFLCLMPLLQLVPLPPAFWQALPGRALAVETLTEAGIAQEWRPLTLAVDATFRSWLMMIWLLAFLLALLELSSTEQRRMFGVMVLLGLLNVMVGVVQVVSGYHIFQFYDQQPFLAGVFANKNHTGLFIAFTLLAGYAVLYGEHGWHRRWLGIVVPVVFVLLIALLATFSRAGLVFGVAALGFLAILSFPRRPRRRTLVIAFGAALIVLAVVATIASSDLASRSSARFREVDGDLRWQIWAWSWPLVGTYFPIGGGIGSFTQLFPPNEHLAWVKPTYVNHVHNDYMEQLIEVGIAAPICWILVVTALVGPFRSAWNQRNRDIGRVALIGAAMLVLTALHSVVDYPLRRPAIAAAVMVALAALLRLNRTKSDCASPLVVQGKSVVR